MCEYSLLSLPSRLAQAGEVLVTYRFSTGTMGLAPADQIDALKGTAIAEETSGLWSTVARLFKSMSNSIDVTVVCIPPGARLRVSHLPPYSKQTMFLTPFDELTFVELDVPENRYRDALRFSGGSVMLLQCVEEGVHFEVLSTDSREPEVYGPQLAFDQSMR